MIQRLSYTQGRPPEYSINRFPCAYQKLSFKCWIKLWLHPILGTAFRADRQIFVFLFSVRNLLLALLSNILSFNEPMLPSGVILVLVTALTLQARYRPFRHSADNMLETASLVLAIINFLYAENLKFILILEGSNSSFQLSSSSFLAILRNAVQGAPASSSFSTFLAAINLIFMTSCFVLIVSKFWTRSRALLQTPRGTPRSK